MLDVENFLYQRYPTFCDQHPWLKKPLVKFLRVMFRESLFKQFQQDHPHVEGFDFVEQVLDYFDFRYSVRDDERQRIPVSGRVVIVANHPIGSLDGLALLKLVREIRPDVKVVANEVLATLEPIHNLLLPVDNMGGKTARKNLIGIHEHLENEGAVIICPAGEVSRFSPRGVRDGKWNSGFVKFATRTRAPILPVFVDGRNSFLFYSVSLIAKPLSTLMLVREMVKQASNCVKMRIGNPINIDTLKRIDMPYREKAHMLKRHLYRIGKSRPGVFATESAIAHPENRAVLRDELSRCELLGETSDSKKIYLYRYQTDSSVMREIGRLREIAFRAVGEGTGQRRDVDHYDKNYFQLVLWDDKELEIAGAYRLREATGLTHDSKELYSATLFEFQPAMEDYFGSGLELGRSFVQPKYWGKRSLDYLWFGIGAFLRKNPQYRYLFGPVSLSNAFPRRAMEMLVHFYGAHFPTSAPLATPKIPYRILPERVARLKERFPGEHYSEEFTQLKSELAHMNLTVPTLYKQYSEITEPGGVQFAGFNVDPDFGDCVDGLIIVDLDKLKESKRLRYIGDHADAA
ncbi:MAG: lysophospholipid acyltransferase family protein [bacterium]